MLGCKGLINKCKLLVAILYSYNLITNTIFYLGDCSLNGCQTYVYEKLADTVLCFVLAKTAVQEQVKMESRNTEQEWVHLVLKKPWKRFLLVLVLLFLVSMNQGILRRIMKIWKMIHLFPSSSSSIRHSTTGQRHRVVKWKRYSR